MIEENFNASYWLNKNLLPVSEKLPDSKAVRFSERNHHAASLKALNNDLFSSLKSASISDYADNAQEKMLNPECSLMLEAIEELKQNAFKQFTSFHQFNKSLQDAIFTEFKKYQTTYSLSLVEIDSLSQIGEHLSNPLSAHHQSCKNFVAMYCHKVSVIYFLKIRFIATLCLKTGIRLTTKDLFNPNSFLSQIFKKGSSTELYATCLHTNQYSWFRPEPSLTHTLESLVQVVAKISISEILLLLCAPLSGSSFPNLDEGLGHYLKTLIIDFPNWFHEHNPPNLLNNLFFNKDENPLTQAKGCRFTGDDLPALALSFWEYFERVELSEAENLLFPEFHEEDFATGFFFRICNEIQLLTALVVKASKQSLPPIFYLCKTMKGKEENSDAQNAQQMNLFSQTSQRLPDRHPRPSDGVLGSRRENKSDLKLEHKNKFNRIILTLSDFPKTNPHFYLFNKIQSQYDDLDSQGLLIVLSGKKIFIPSQSEKVEILLQSFRLEGAFALDDLVGKNKLYSYCYIFSKCEKKKKRGDIFETLCNIGDGQSKQNSKKRPCLSFRFRNIEGDEFSENNMALGTVAKGLQNFFKARRPESTPLFQQELSSDILFEFYQDAILDGRLINSSSKDSSSITHPSFFKNMMRSCIPLNTFFYLDSIRGVKGEAFQIKDPNPTHDPLGVVGDIEENYAFIFVIDFRIPECPKIEIIAAESYRGKSSEYGYALCHYFGVIPKIPNININLFREFFDSAIGMQFIQLSLTGTLKKLKTKVESLLIPKFFQECIIIPEFEAMPLKMLTYQEKEILGNNLIDLEHSFQEKSSIIIELAQHYPWSVLSLLSFFNHNLNKAITNFGQMGNAESINYSNPSLISALTSLPKFPIYPDNTEVYIEYALENPEDIHLSLTETQFVSQNSSPLHHQQQLCFLELYHRDTVVLKIHSEPEALDFLRFLLKTAVNVPISDILLGIQMPSPLKICSVVHSFQASKKHLESLKAIVVTLISRVLKSHIMNGLALAHAPKDHHHRHDDRH